MPGKFTKGGAFITKIGQKKIEEALQKKLRSQVEKAKKFIDADIKKLFVFMLMRHPVSRSLMGEFSGLPDGSDLTAEFGIFPNEGEDVVLKISQDAQSTIDTKVEKKARSVVIKVTGLSGLGGIGPPSSEGSRISESSGYIVDWLFWLYNAKRFTNSSPIDTEHGISYRLIAQEAGFTSRTGNAVMIPPIFELGYEKQYTLPAFVIPTNNADNFIEEIVFDPIFINRMEDIIRNRVKGLNITRLE